MCLIFIAFKKHPVYKLIVAANRDEFYNRKTAAAHFWNDHPHVLAGRDLEASGTWLGINTSGKISMVTNYRDIGKLKQNAPSRGHLVSDFLISPQEPLEYMQHVENKGGAYNGFNLIVGDAGQLFYYSNYKNKIEPVSPGIHGLSNHLLDTPWPKVRRGLMKVEPLMTEKFINSDALLDALYDAETANDNELPDTGIGLELERTLSSMFIKSPGYGSRSSTVVLIDHANTVMLKERVYDINTFGYTEKSYAFTIDKK